MGYVGLCLCQMFFLLLKALIILDFSKCVCLITIREAFRLLITGTPPHVIALTQSFPLSLSPLAYHVLLSPKHTRVS